MASHDDHIDTAKATMEKATAAVKSGSVISSVENTMKNMASAAMTPIFTQIQEYVTKKISAFVSFFFLLISVGIFYALIITGTRVSNDNMIPLLVPPVLGLIAYFNSDFALVILVLLIIIFSLLMLFIFI